MPACPRALRQVRGVFQTRDVKGASKTLVFGLCLPARRRREGTIRRERCRTGRSDDTHHALEQCSLRSRLLSVATEGGTMSQRPTAESRLPGTDASRASSCFIDFYLLLLLLSKQSSSNILPLSLPSHRSIPFPSFFPSASSLLYVPSLLPLFFPFFSSSALSHPIPLLIFPASPLIHCHLQYHVLQLLLLLLLLSFSLVLYSS